MNHLDTTFKKGNWTKEEDLYLLECILKQGKKWALISKNMGSRNENSVKNRFFSLIRKQLKGKTNRPIQEQDNILKIIKKLKENCPNKEEKKECGRKNSQKNNIKIKEIVKESKENLKIEKNTDLVNNVYNNEEFNENNTNNLTQPQIQHQIPNNYLQNNNFNSIPFPFYFPYQFNNYQYPYPFLFNNNFF